MALCSVHNSSKILDRGADTYGCWAWIRLGDPTKRCVTFFSVYRPNTSGGISSSYQQQVRALQLPHTTSREQLYIDLQVAVETCHARGDTVIIGIDNNEDIRGRCFRQFLTASHLWNPLIEIHGKRGPATHSRNSRGIPIDALICTRGITPHSC